MGADLIGIFVVGPKKLKPAKCEAAVKKLIKRQEKLRAVSVEDEAAVTKAIEKYFPDFFDHSGSDYLNPPQARAFLVSADFAAVAEALQTLWSRGSRDCVSRGIGGGRRALFCGNATWTDDGTGFGYQTLHTARLLGLLELVGID